MTQLVTRMAENVIEQIDLLVSRGVATSRSDVVRRALTEFFEREEDRRVSEEYAEAYRLRPETPDEPLLAWDEGRRLVEEEPW